MRKWQLGIALILSAIGLAVGTPHTVEAKLAPGIQNNTAGNVDKITNMRNTPAGAPYAADEGIMDSTAYGTGKPISNGQPGNNDNVGSPVDIQIGNVNGASANSSGNWFVMNYINAPAGPNYMYFNTKQDAINFQAGNTDYGNITNKMTLGSDGSRTLAPDSNYDGGYLNVSGNVPVHVVIQSTGYAVDTLLQGNWGVMVKVTLPNDIDEKSIANAIMWDKSFFYLDIAIANSALSGIKVNFPLQFDHHVYNDPTDPKSFFLKVKGIPYNLPTEDYSIPIIGGHKKAYFIPRQAVDVADLNNNKMVSGTTTTNVVNLKSVTAGGKTFQGDQGDTYATQPMWGLSPIYLGAVASMNNFSKAAALFNMLIQSGRRTDVGVLTGIGTWLAPLLTGDGFDGNARINFNIDLSKYNGGLDQRYRPLTRGRLFPSMNANGTFNSADGTSGPLAMTMFPSSSMVDPRSSAPNFAAVAQQDRDANADSPGGNYGSNANEDALSKIPGTTPVDYAVLNKSLADNPKLTYTGANSTKFYSAVRFPVVTNFTSWNSFVVPYDNRQDTATNPVTYYKTILPNTPPIPIESDSQVGSTILNRTAQPDFYKDGVFVNTGTAYKGVSDDKYVGTSDTEINAALNTVPNLAKGLTGAVTPKRYTRAYSYFNFNPNDSTSVGTKVDPQEITSNANVSFQATEKDPATGPTSITDPSSSSISGNASAAGKGITSLLGNPSKDEWALTGTYSITGKTGAVTKIPMLPAPLKLDQQIQPKVGNEQAQNATIKRSQITSGPVNIPDRKAPGFSDAENIWTWSDPSASSTTPDKLLLKMTKSDGTSSTVQIGTITKGQKDPAPLNFIFDATATAPSAKFESDNTLNVTIPISSTDTFNKYDLEFQPMGLQIASTDGTNGYWTADSSKFDDSNIGHFLLNVLIADEVDKSVEIQNYFYNTSKDMSTPLADAFSQQFVGSTQTNSQVTVKGSYHNTGTGTLKDIDLLIPTPSGVTTAPPQVNTQTGTQLGSFATIPNDPISVSGYAHYRYTGANLPADGYLYYSYTMTVDATKLTLDSTPLTTEALNMDDGKMTYQGEANTISLVKSTGVQLLSTPTLRFGKTWNAGGTPQPYRLTKESTVSDVQFTTRPNTPVDFLFQYLDGNPQTKDSTGKLADVPGPNQSWSLTASLSAFENQDASADPQSGFKIDYGRGEPAQTNGTIIMADSYLTNDGRVDTGILPGETGKYATDPDPANNVISSVRVGHTSNTITSDNSSSVLYRSTDLYENRYLKPSQGSKFLIRYDMTDTVNGVTTPNPSVKLTVPQAAFSTIKPGTYVSTASYTVNNALQ